MAGCLASCEGPGCGLGDGAVLLPAGRAVVLAAGWVVMLAVG